MFPTWWRKLINPVKRKTRKAGRPRQPSVRPRLVCLAGVERLEDRIVPTAITIPTNLIAIRNSIVSVPINVDTLNDPANGNSGLSGADLVVFFDPSVFSVSASDVSLGTISTNGSTALGNGYSPVAPNGWDIEGNFNATGEMHIGISNGGGELVTNTGSGSLAVVNFHVKVGVGLGVSHLDLAADFLLGPPETILSDQNFNSYSLNPAPQDNTQLDPYVYSGTDPDDGLVTITGVNLPPVANNEGYSVTERSFASDPALAANSNAIQTISFLGTVTGGTFALGFNGQSTQSISYSSVSGTLQTAIQNALNGLSTIGTGNTSVSAANSTSVSVLFQNALGGVTQPTMTYSSNLRATATLPGGQSYLTVATTTLANTDVLANDTDPQGFSLTAVNATNPTHGTLIFSSNGSFVYTPNLGYLGPDRFTYQANDGSNNSNVATVNISVTAVLSIPTNLTATPGGIRGGARQPE